MFSIFHALVINNIYYIKSEYRFVAGLLYIIDILSEEVDTPRIEAG